MDIDVSETMESEPNNVRVVSIAGGSGSGGSAKAPSYSLSAILAVVFGIISLLFPFVVLLLGGRNRGQESLLPYVYVFGPVFALSAMAHGAIALYGVGSAERSETRTNLIGRGVFGVVFGGGVALFWAVLLGVTFAMQFPSALK